MCALCCLQQESQGACAICTTLGVYIVRITADGQPVVLHSLLRPDSAREGCLPYASWRMPFSPGTGQHRPSNITSAPFLDFTEVVFLGSQHS